jgi:hypothetical protein
VTGQLRRINPRAYPIARAHTAAGEALYQELEWYADAEPPRLLGLVLRDLVDNDYSWVVMARAPNLQYRAVDMETSLRASEAAVSALHASMDHWMAESDAALANALG